MTSMQYYLTWDSIPLQCEYNIHNLSFSVHERTRRIKSCFSLCVKHANLTKKIDRSLRSLLWQIFLNITQHDECTYILCSTDIVLNVCLSTALWTLEDSKIQMLLCPFLLLEKMLVHWVVAIWMLSYHDIFPCSFHIYLIEHIDTYLCSCGKWTKPLSAMRWIQSYICSKSDENLR
jgi:hypothetical protein